MDVVVGNLTDTQVRDEVLSLKQERINKQLLFLLLGHVSQRLPLHYDKICHKHVCANYVGTVHLIFRGGGAWVFGPGQDIFFGQNRIIIFFSQPKAFITYRLSRQLHA